jgi:ABC-type glycerol-3-phosphate transport system substrate-binding protein
MQTLNRSSLIRLGLGLLLLSLVACGEQATPTPLPPIPPTATAEIAPVVDETVVPNADDQLVVWLPAFAGTATEGSAGAILTNAFHQFEQRNPSINLDVQVKADAGSASLFNFLRSAQQVAPTILPDLVLINTQQLWQIVDLGMVAPLREEERLSNVDFFPVTRAAVNYRAQTVGIPYSTDITHLAYDVDEIDTPPSTWVELLEGGEPLLFPAAEVGTTNATLLLYIGAGGALLEDGTINDAEAIEGYFAFLAESSEQGIIPATVLDMPSYNAVWRAFAEDRSNLAAAQVMQFYPNAAGIKPPGYTLLPTRSGESVTIADTWAFAILTEDAQRRQLAVALVNELLNPEVQGAWSQATARLPSQPASLALWTQVNDYRDFAQSLLGDAIAIPNGPAFADFARRLHAAQAGILRGDLTIEAAIASMVVIE